MKNLLRSSIPLSNQGNAFQALLPTRRNVFMLIAAAALSGLASPVALAHSSSLSFDNAWIRASAPGQKNGAAYVQITNSGSHDMQLAGASSDRTERIELHTIDRTSGVARMKEVETINIPSNKKVALEPGGYHLMMINIKEPFKEGETVPLTLQFKDAEPVTVDFEVKPITFQPNESGPHGHGSGHGHH